MLCTFVWDAYRRDERADGHKALNDLLPVDSPDWSRQGVYAYWNRDTHEVLYLGLASDLPTRFAQHNGIVGHGGGNKKEQIDAYFSAHTHLGFTIVVQGAAVAIPGLISQFEPMIAITGKDFISVGEGQLIEMHRLTRGNVPPWNKTGGAKAGQRFAQAAPALVEVLSGQAGTLFVARRTLRELANDEAAQRYEAAIHAARMEAFEEGHGVRLEDLDTIAASDSEEAIHRVSRSLMLSHGHILEELDVSNEEIVAYLKNLGSREFWERRAALSAQRMSEIRASGLDAKGEIVATIIEMVTSLEAPDELLRDVEEIFEKGYLEEAPRIPPNA